MGSATNGGGSCEMPMAENDAGQGIASEWTASGGCPARNERQFDRFVRANGYVTIAERTPTKEEFPDAPSRNL